MKSLASWPLAAEELSTVDTTLPTNISPGTLAAVWDTESLLDIEDGYCRFRVAPSVMVWDEVHKGNPCVGIVDKAAFRKGEAAIMIARKADNTEGFVSFHRYVDNLLQCPTVRRARLRDREVL